jgi:hypothetical protein
VAGVVARLDEAVVALGKTGSGCWAWLGVATINATSITDAKPDAQMPTRCSVTTAAAADVGSSCQRPKDRLPGGRWLKPGEHAGEYEAELADAVRTHPAGQVDRLVRGYPAERVKAPSVPVPRASVLPGPGYWRAPAPARRAGARPARAGLWS